MSTPAKVEISVDVIARLDALVKSQEAFRKTREEAMSLGNMLATGLGVGSGMALVTQAMLGIKNAIRASFGEAVALAGALNDQSEALGISTTALQVLSLEFKAAGADAGRLNEAISTQTRGLAEARDLSSATALAYRQLGLVAAEVEKLLPEERLIAVARATKNHADQTVALNAASTLLGSRGLLLMLSALDRLGTEGVASVTEFYEQAGAIMSRDTIARLDAAEKQWGKFWHTMVIGSGETLGFVDRLVDSLKAMPAETLLALAGAVAGGGSPIAAADLVRVVAKNTAGDASKKPGAPITGPTFDSAQMKADAEAAKVLETARKAAAEQLAREGEAVTNTVLTPYEKYNRALEKLNELHIGGAITTDIYRRANKQAADELAAALVPAQSLIDKLKEQGLVLHDQLLTPMEQYNAQLRELDRLLAAGAIDPEDHARGKDRAQQSLTASTTTAPVTAGPSAAPEGVMQNLHDWADQLPTQAQLVASSFANTVGGAVNTVSDGLTGLITKTRTWGDMGRAMGNLFLTSLVQVGVQMVANSLLHSTLSAKDKAEDAGSLGILALKGGLKALGQLGPIYGTIAFIAALAGIVALTKGFSQGGHTGPGGIVHEDEWVAPQWMVNSPTYGPMIDSLEGARTGSSSGLDTYSVGRASISGGAVRGASGGGDTDQPLPSRPKMLVVYTNDQAMVETLKRSPDHEAHVLDIMQRGKSMLIPA